MRISNGYGGVGGALGQGASATTTVARDDISTPERTQGHIEAATRVTVSNAARSLADGQRSSDVDDAKVASLRASIQSGGLKIDGTKIAARIVDGD